MYADEIPVIDIERLDASATLAALDRACREWGFMQVVGHGVAPAVTEALAREAHAFFRQPAARKRAISRTAENPWGFFDRELTKNTRDWKEIYDVGPPSGAFIAPQWPDGLPGLGRPCVPSMASASGSHSVCWRPCRPTSVCRPRT
jgi:isopenicillin N synthase-like dioxygenase